MSQPHKVKLVATNASTYSMAAVCEYCGQTAFYGNKDGVQNGFNVGGCPNSPDFTTILGTEILSMIQRIGNTSNGRTEGS
jgi:hypothetical protein